ncbi:hypothetical protein TNCV_2788201 [Trichonephila clavipes]|uniref:Transposase IS30-like HTH domain-containing protein n=1 Tax=Trichonephila clavipes TaxID=2585209 RepID=A0A8X6T1K5_TRICX|nr:hypothetical protein TNCV_2788201 [Trichonephila clavipes]
MWHHIKPLFKAWRFRRFQVRQLCFSCDFFKKRSAMSRGKQRSAFDQVSEFDKGKIVAYRDCGLSFREIGGRVGRDHTWHALSKGSLSITRLNFFPGRLVLQIFRR